MTDRELPFERLSELMAAVSSVFFGKQDVIEKVLAALLARGNLLIEDIPGVGKTTLAQALAGAVNCSFRRIQFTSDLLPSDILGVKVYEPANSEFKFMPGPIFHSIVLADEINRTTPRTQSALLEAMNEGQVTIEGETYPLPQPFMVVATQNPIEQHGTYPLPDSQLDRFLMSIEIGYPDVISERKILTRELPTKTAIKPGAVMDSEEVARWQERADKVRMEPELLDYIMEIVNLTRGHNKLRLGASPRGALALNRAAKARALVKGRDFCIPDDIKEFAVPVLAHRVIPAGGGGAKERKQTAVEAIEEILDSVTVPV